MPFCTGGFSLGVRYIELCIRRNHPVWPQTYNWLSLLERRCHFISYSHFLSSEVHPSLSTYSQFPIVYVYLFLSGTKMNTRSRGCTRSQNHYTLLSTLLQGAQKDLIDSPTQFRQSSLLKRKLDGRKTKCQCW